MLNPQQFSQFDVFFLFVLNWTEALQLVISECKPDVKIVDICEKGDSFIRE